MRTPPTVLLLDHRGSGLAERLAGLEAAGFAVEATASVRASLDRLAADWPAALVLDPLLEGGAVEVEALDRAGAAEIPLLLLCAADRCAATLEVLARSSARVADFARRDANAVEVRARLERLLGEDARRAELAELRHRALYDDRTELLRPEAFDRRLSEHWSAAERHGYELALVIADLDRFGQFNKRYDHTVGDRVLSRVGDAIRSALRAEDVAGRLGGDEFGCILPYTRKADAARVVQRLRERIRSVSGRVGGADLAISASLGFETFDGRDLESVEALRAHAEIALRDAKRRGGDRAVYYRLLVG
jgi:diguanylate cyclase (GGDEF)-like protein